MSLYETRLTWVIIYYKRHDSCMQASRVDWQELQGPREKGSCHERDMTDAIREKLKATVSRSGEEVDPINANAFL
jgi:hypothetical protein